MATNNLSSTIVLELLRNDNYANWCAWMKNYLLAQDLWDIVQATTEPPKQHHDVVGFKAWTKNNAAALHAILISCEVDILTGIREITSAKKVWDELARMYGPDNSSSTLGRINSALLERLRTAINNGNWDAARDFLNNNEEAKTARITDRGSTVLHLAVFTGNREIVENLVRLLSEKELEIKDDEDFTALAWAAVRQNNTGMLDCMLRKNTNLLDIPDNSNRIPLIAALEYGNIEVARYLYSASLNCDQRFSDIDASTVLTQFILVNNFDLALHFLQRCPRAAIVPNMYDSSPLAALAEKSSAFPSGMQLDPEEKRIYDSIPIPSEHSTNEIEIDIHSPSEHQSDQAGINRSRTKIILRELKKLPRQTDPQLLHRMCSQVKQMNGDSVSGAIFQAIKGGMIEFIDEILKVDHQLLYITDTMGRNILFYAVLYRQDKIFDLIRKLDERNLIINARDKSSNTILHMAAMLESSTKSDRRKGKVLKIQSELEWFKVESHCLPWIKEIRNDTKMTARELFTHNHKDMMKEGEKWMKRTATSSTVIGALIITIMFAAAITVPGGNNQNTGFPMFSHKTSFMVFIVSNALSLFCSSTSVFIFLEILTLPQSEEDFLEWVPTKIIWGYYTLFYSIITMMIAFCATLFIILPERSRLIIPVFVLAYIPVYQFSSIVVKLVTPLAFRFKNDVLSKIMIRLASIY